MILSLFYRVIDYCIVFFSASVGAIRRYKIWFSNYSKLFLNIIKQTTTPPNNIPNAIPKRNILISIPYSSNNANITSITPYINSAINKIAIIVSISPQTGIYTFLLFLLYILPLAGQHENYTIFYSGILVYDGIFSYLFSGYIFLYLQIFPLILFRTCHKTD